MEPQATLLVPMGPGIIPEVSLVLKRSLCLPINLDLNEPSGFVLARLLDGHRTAKAYIYNIYQLLNFPLAALKE